MRLWSCEGHVQARRGPAAGQVFAPMFGSTPWSFFADNSTTLRARTATLGTTIVAPDDPC